ncbi:Major facilitator superfamily (MFS) profile domain-containing protein [[Candida] zeylanoides]
MTDSIELERYSQSVVSETSRPYSRSASPSPSPRPDGEHDEYPEGGRKAYTVLFGSFIGLVSNLGIIGSIGAIQAYVSTHQLKGVKTSTVSWIFSIYLALSYAIGLFIGPVFDRRGPKGLLLCATVLVTAGFLATANSTNVWQLILSLSICVGVGNALAMTPLIGVVNHWFFVKRGNATGIATSGGSVGGLAIPLMLRYLYEKYSFEWAIRILAFFSLGCMVVALLLVEERVRYTKEDAPEVAGSNPPQPQNGRFARWVAATTQSVRTTLATLKDPKYSYLICGAFCGELALILVVTFFATYAIAQGVSESTSYVLLSVWNCTGILGRWLPGYLSDRFGKFNVNILMLLGLDVCIFVIWLPFGQSLKALYVFVSFGGFFSGSILSMMPTCLGQISPVREFGHRYGLLLFFLSLGNLFGVPLGATIIGDGSQHNYDMFVVLVGALCSVGLFFWVVSRYCIVGLRVNVKV